MSTNNNTVDYLFDWRYYIALHLDLPTGGIDTETEAKNHFFNHGLREGRQFNPFVDLAYYRTINGDLRPLNNEQLYFHLQNHGIGEGRTFSPYQSQINQYYASNQRNFLNQSNSRQDLFDELVFDLSFNRVSLKLISPHRFSTNPIAGGEPPTIAGALTLKNPSDSYHVYSHHDTILAKTSGAVSVSVVGANSLGNVSAVNFYEVKAWRDVRIEINRQSGRTNSVEWYQFEQYKPIKGTDNSDTLFNLSNSRAVLMAGGGNDTLTGGSSYDIFFGGAGRDTFFASTLHNGTQTDVIADFNPSEDKINIRNLLSQQGITGGNLVSRGLVDQSHFYPGQTVLYLDSSVYLGQPDNRFLTLQGTLTLSDANFV